jgi:hypothetical protein
MAFDIKCYELAQHFLPDNAPEQIKSKLAQVIQDDIEDWLSILEEERLRKQEEQQERERDNYTPIYISVKS